MSVRKITDFPFIRFGVEVSALNKLYLRGGEVQSRF